MNYFIKVIQNFGIGGWIGLAGFVFGMVVAIGATATTAGGAPLLFLIPIILGICWIFWHFMLGPMVQHERLMDIGVEADATIVSFRENGSSIQIGGALPKAGVRLELDVHARDRAPFRATVDTFVSLFEVAKFQPGMALKVKYDPQKPQKLTIAEGVPTAGMYGSRK